MRRTADTSQAEQLAALLPHSRIVKCFNVLSAYALENGGQVQAGKQVPLAGDDRAAREEVAAVVRAAGFTPVDMGQLLAARAIEDIPVSLFSQWRTPLYIHLAIFTFLYLLWFVKAQVSDQIKKKKYIYDLSSPRVTADLLAHHLVLGRLLPVAPLEPHPHGQREQDAGGPLPGHARPLLPARGAGRLAAARPRHQVLQVPVLARQLAQDAQTARPPHALRCLHSCEGNTRCSRY